MATYSSREIISRRIEYTVPAAQPWGADYGEIGKAARAAWADLRERRDLPAGADMPDDALRFFPSDDEIIISFTIEETVR